MASNEVPSTSISRSFMLTRNGRSVSLRTSKNASPVRATSRVFPEKSASYFNRLSPLSHTFVPSGRVNSPTCPLAVSSVTSLFGRERLCGSEIASEEYQHHGSGHARIAQDATG